MNQYIMMRMQVPDDVLLELVKLILDMGTIPQLYSWDSEEKRRTCRGINRVELITHLRARMQEKNPGFTVGLKETKDFVDSLVEHLKRGTSYQAS